MRTVEKKRTAFNLLTLDTSKQYKHLLTPCQVSMVYELLSELFHMKRVLDVGCATGEYLSKFSFDSIGVDCSLVNVEICKNQGLNVVTADLNKGLPFEDETFDISLCSHILEHVDAPINLLREIQRVLKENGIIVISVPVERSLARFLLKDHYFKAHPTHLYSFSVSGMERLLSSSQFTLEKVLFDIPLLKRLKAKKTLRMAQFLPKRLGVFISGNLWYVARKIR